MSYPHQFAQIQALAQAQAQATLEMEEGACFKKPRIGHGNHTWSPPTDAQPMNYSKNLSAQCLMRPAPLAMPAPQNASSRRLTAVFYKTRLCQKFLSNSCHQGTNCNYAHGPEELRLPPPNWEELVPSGRMNKICIKFASGEVCPYGASCMFLHQRPRPAGDSTAAAVVAPANFPNMAMPAGSSAASNGWNGNGAHPQQQSAGSAGPTNPKPQHWKTKTCHQWEATGRCQYGAQCNYAHGLAELNRFGSRLDVSSTSDGAAPKSLPSIPPATSAQVTPSKTELTGENADMQKKGFRRWKRGVKINGIYGDWIDDLSTHDSISPSKAV